MSDREYNMSVERLLEADYKSGKFSQRDLVIKYGFSKGKVSRLCKGKKADNGALVEEAVHTTIKQHEIMGKIGALSGADKQKVLFDIQEATNKAQVLNMFDHTTVQNQVGINKIQKQILEGEITKEDIFDLGSLSKITESNRKQILGATTSFIPAPEKDLNEVKSGVGELYKAMGD